MRDEDCQLGNETVGTQVFFLNFCLSSNEHLMKFLTLVQGEAYALVCRKFKTSRSLNKSSTLWGEKSICTLSFSDFLFQ